MIRYAKLDAAGLLSIIRAAADYTNADQIKIPGVKHCPSFKFRGWRLSTFVRKGHVCVRCGREGSHFYVERHPNETQGGKHLNLYAVDPDGTEVLMTVDHIVPKSLGGSNDLSNLQPMCMPCNQEKGNRYIG